jgi:hypothetical protein
MLTAFLGSAESKRLTLHKIGAIPLVTLTEDFKRVSVLQKRELERRPQTDVIAETRLRLKRPRKSADGLGNSGGLMPTAKNTGNPVGGPGKDSEREKTGGERPDLEVERRRGVDAARRSERFAWHGAGWRGSGGFGWGIDAGP